VTSWTPQKLRHALALLWQGSNPAATVYDSIGTDFFLAPAPGWLNLGLWEGPGGEEEAPRAVRRLVEQLAGELPKGGVILDVGNGLGAQDPVIAEVASPRRLVAMNITASQLVAGRDPLSEAGADPVVADAMRIPLADGSADGIISVEAAFHFRSRRRFFTEAYRVLRPGGVLTMSDVPVSRVPRRPREVLAGVSQLRLWGLRASSAMTAGQIEDLARAAGFEDVRTRHVAERVIDPALRLARLRLEQRRDVPASIRLPSAFLLSQVELLRARGILDYILLTAVR
jgi:SAM-dependent methyltransferase